MITFIKSKTTKDQKRIVLFQIGNYQYEIWSQTSKRTVRKLMDNSHEDAVAIFNSL